MNADLAEKPAYAYASRITRPPLTAGCPGMRADGIGSANIAFREA